MENSRIIQAELNELAPLLNTISKKPVQSIPDGYFENFQVQIPSNQSTIQTSVVPVVSINARPKWFAMAAAAVVIGLLVMGGFNLMNQSKISFNQGMVIHMEQIAKMDISAAVQALSNDDIDQYLSTANALAGPENSLHQYTVDAFSETTVDEISDEELQFYLTDKMN